MIKKDKTAFCLHPEISLVNKLVTLEENEKMKFNLEFDKSGIWWMETGS